MNSIFSRLDKEKQLKIINASLEVFSNNTYKQALTDDISAKAQIAKGSLFHYFKNKKSLYLYMYKYALTKLSKKVNTYFNFNERDFFNLVKQSMLLKNELYKDYPNLYQFIVKANEEQNIDLANSINNINKTMNHGYIDKIYKKADYSKFKKNTDFKMLFNMLDWCGIGLRDDGLKNGDSIDKMHQQAVKIIDFLKQATYKQEYL